mmetsp:Transcript_19138/g.48625  ORF Transcript_19138/g.48625 Transcript_19138/m.48625 type:complete len:257 (-) Transcript_19138:196-966(-)|eukprot:CAMPEP_0202870952 /NCGR_PEP_ID=MMETSP1391-20130828/17308_1 /ASSEMBLY_ACC=CAM_ASM_000867 /TAXON_ID=1034604 /ORGANISM="Chlamydomonas leiostraca, Strain SAG 11-49" /LENGTH=256 /DNA_ID=CAMNT_0049551641 /DNA_START=190 /DNA_END=960 /DNA_ORIENTATION=-
MVAAAAVRQLLACSSLQTYQSEHLILLGGLEILWRVRAEQDTAQLGLIAPVLQRLSITHLQLSQLAVAAPSMTALVDAGIAAKLVKLSLTNGELAPDACSSLSSFPSLRSMEVVDPMLLRGHMQAQVVGICTRAPGPLKLRIDKKALGQGNGWEQALWQQLQAAGTTDRVQLPPTIEKVVAGLRQRASTAIEGGQLPPMPQVSQVKHPGTLVFRVMWEGQQSSDESESEAGSGESEGEESGSDEGDSDEEASEESD